MRRAFWILAIFLLLCVSPHTPVHFIEQANAQLNVGGGGTSVRCLTGGLPLDANGWTVYPAGHTLGSSSIGKTYYVSSSIGNNATAVADDVTKPYQTIIAAINAMKSWAGGNNSKTDSWLLLKRGDIFTDQNIGGNFASISGIDCLHPMVISSYDPSQPGVPDPYGNWTVSGITCSAGTATITTTTAHGLTNGGAYQIVLTRELPAGFNGKFSGTVTGASTLTFPITCPAASDTLHGLMALRRPVLSVTTLSSTCGPSDAGNGSDSLIFSGIECYSPKYDPDNVAWDKTAYSKTLSLFTTASRITSQVIENTNTTFNFYNSVDAQPNAVDTTGLNLTLRRNVNYYSAGSYFQGWLNLNLIENYSFYDGWNPYLAGGQPVTMTTGTPGVVAWGGSLNPLVGGSPNCSAVKFSGGTLPKVSATTTGTTTAGNSILQLGSIQASFMVIGTVVTNRTAPSVIPVGTTITSVDTQNNRITLSANVTGAGVGNGDVIDFLINTNMQFYVTTPSGNNFNLANTCGGTALELSGSPSGVTGYWFGTANFGFPGIYPQGGNCGGGCVHTYYLQNGAGSLHGVYNITTRGNVLGFTAGSTLQGGGNSDQNLMFQSWSPLTAGKRGETAEKLAYTNTNNGVFKVAQPWNAIPYTTISSGTGPLVTTGLTLGGRAGTNTAVNNLIAYEATGVPNPSGFGHGIDSTDINYYPMVSEMKNNVACGLTTPIKPNQGLIIEFDTIVPGSGYSEYRNPPNAGAQASSYYSPFGLPGQSGIPAIGGSGYGLGLVVTINPATGGVSNVTFQYQQIGIGYKVGDIITSANTYLGGSGSGWSARVSSVGNHGDVSGFDTLVPGSGYIAGTTATLTGGSGTGAQGIIAMGPYGCNTSCSLQAIYAYTGYGYQVGDILTVSATHTGAAATARVSKVINNTMSGNTFKAADCTNLQSATGSGGVGQPNSVPPPATPLANPPTDVIGDYFATLPYGYQYPIPPMLSGSSTGYEQGYMHQASLQQKANWDANLMAKSILDWARPQFGMVNP